MFVSDMRASYMRYLYLKQKINITGITCLISLLGIIRIPNIWRLAQKCGTHSENNVAKSIGTTPEKKFDATVLKPAQLLGNNINEFRVLLIFLTL